MKNLKKIVTIVLTVVMLCAFSTAVFAAGNLSNQNTYAVTALPVELTEGDTSVVVDFVIAQTGAGAADLVLDGSAAKPTTIKIGMSVDENLSISAAEKITTSLPGASIASADYDAGYFLVIVNLTSAATLTKTTPVLTIDFDLASAAVANAAYTLSYDPSIGDEIIITDQLSNAQSGVFASNPDIVLTAKAAAQDPVITGTPARETITVGETAYSNVWIGDYSIVLNGNTATTALVKFVAEDKTFEVAPRSEGEGKVAFKIAIVGVPMNVAAPTVTIQ